MKTLTRGVFTAVIAAASLQANPEVRLDLGGGVSLTMIEVPAGTFLRGSPADESGRSPDETQAQVTIRKPFLIGKHPVTVAQWGRFVSETGYRSEAETGTSGGFGWNGSALAQNKTFTWRNPGFPQTADHPVCIVTHNDSLAFCKWIERKSHRKTSLPTEAQWEYACRAGTTTAWHTGNTAADGERAAWHKGNAGNSTHAVQEKAENPWGLVIGGNVAEWCLDWFGPYPPGDLTDPLQENRNLSDKPRRVQRGGSWNRDAKNTRSAARWRSDPGSRTADNGFRLVCSIEVEKPVAPPPPTPKVEAEPGVTMPARPTPAMPPVRPPAPPSPPVHRSPLAEGVGSIFSSLLCLAVPLGLVALLFKFIIGHGKNPANPFVEPSLIQPDPDPLPDEPAGLIRKTQDGFWLHGPWSVGSRLRVRYTIGGDLTEMNIDYQPGAQGQFIFTGAPPESVSVVTDDGLESMIPPPLPAASDWRREDRDEDTRGPRPPRFPSAY